MHRRLIFVICSCLMLAGSVFLAAKDTDSLYIRLYGQASKNLKLLPQPAKSDYTKLLKDYPDRLMAFLLAYEENGRLAATNPKVLLNHYQSVKELMQEQGIIKPDEFFLSYVAKITVSDEAVTDYRHQFEKAVILTSEETKTSLTLKEYRQSVKDPLELYRQACLKTTEWLLYKPTSGRDQSPLDVVNKSLSGRCEESQILFASLCRTLGIPARAASTPWWAHQDDNHAWVEVFINGSWHYTGDTDGGYWLDQTWFSGAVNKMVIITADSSLPAKDDEVLAQDRYGAVINSIKYYAGENTRTLKIKVIDKDGQPVRKCNLGIDVYNFYSLRPQVFTTTDDKGEKTITVGQGSFFLTAFKDSLATLQFVPSGNNKLLEYTLKLERSALPAKSVIMEYPAKTVEFKDAPQSWKDDVKLAKTNRMKRQDEAERQAEIELPTQDSLLVQVVKKARLNYPEFLSFLKTDEIRSRMQSEQSDSLFNLWLQVLLANDEKDLWQGDAALFHKMFAWFEYLSPKVKDLQEAEMLNLFEPTVFYENLPWQSYYYGSAYPKERFYPQKMIMRKPAKPTPQQVSKFYSRGHKVKPQKALSGLLTMDTALNQKYLADYQNKVLACSYFRANQIPAQYTRLQNVVSVYADGAWKYFDLSKRNYYETEAEDKQAMRQVTFRFTDEQNQPVALKTDQVLICFFKNGQFFPTNLQPDYQGNGIFTALVPRSGTFYAQIGYRNSDSLTVYYLRPLSEKGIGIDSFSLKLDYYRQTWSPVERFLLPVTQELDSLGYAFAVLGNATGENCLRMAAKLKEMGKPFVFGGYESGQADNFNYRILNSFYRAVQDVPSLQNRTITLVKNEQNGSWQMYEGLWDSLP